MLDGVDGILLGQETLRGCYPVEAVQTVVSICKQVCATGLGALRVGWLKGFGCCSCVAVVVCACS